MGWEKGFLSKTMEVCKTLTPKPKNSSHPMIWSIPVHGGARQDGIPSSPPMQRQPTPARGAGALLLCPQDGTGCLWVTEAVTARKPTRPEDVPESRHASYQDLLFLVLWKPPITISVMLLFAEEDSENALLPNISQSHTHTQWNVVFSPFWSMVERWEHAAPPCLEGYLSKAPTNGSTNFSDSVIAHYLLQLHFDDLGDNTKRKETVIFVLTFPQNASFPDKAIVLWIWKACLKALLKCSVLVFNQKRWSGSNPYTTMAWRFLGCARCFPFSWTILFTIPPLKGLIKDLLCLGIWNKS